MREMKGWRLFYHNPLGLDLECTNAVPYFCIYFLFFFQFKIRCYKGCND